MRKSGAFLFAVALIVLSPLLMAGRSVATPDDNNDFATAVEVQKGYYVVDSVSTVDDLDDFYKIYLEVGEEIVANLLVPTGADFDLYLYDTGQNEINRSERDNILEDNPYERVGAIAGSAGWYYVDVYARSGSGVYGLMISETAEWTYMIYLDADNNLETEGINDFLEMSAVGSTLEVNIVVEFDRWYAPGDPWDDTSYGDWRDCNRFLVGPGTAPTEAESLMDLGEVNMGDAWTVIDFVNWSLNMFPAHKYALDLWDHGGSWYGVCWDDGSFYDYIDMDELMFALDTTYSQNDGLLLDLIGYDACNMASVEVGLQAQDYARVIVGSELTEPGPGWNYELDVEALVNNASMGPEFLGTMIVADYVDSYRIPIPPYFQSEVTLSALLSAGIAEINLAVEDFATTLLGSWQLFCEYFRHARNHPAETYDGTFTDLYHLAELTLGHVPNATIQTRAQSIMDAINASVIANDHWNMTGGMSTVNAHGITIYFPQELSYYDPAYESTPFALSTDWDELLRTYYYSTTNHAPQIVSYSPGSDPTIDEGQEQLFSIDASDSDGNFLIYSWYLDSLLLTDEASSSYTYYADEGSAGTHTVRARVTDGSMTASRLWTMTVREADLSPPSSEAQGPSEYWRIAAPMTITATASDDEGAVSNVTLWYRFSVDNISWTDWLSFGIDLGQPWSWAFDFPDGDGYYEFYTRAIDARGNQETAPVSCDLAYALDMTAPEIAVTGASTASTGDAYSIMAQVSDALGVSHVYAVFWFGSGAQTNSTMVPQGDFLYELVVPIPLDDLTTLHYAISAVDLRGNWNSSITVDAPVEDNDAPTADAGENVDVMAGGQVMFDGSGSTDNIGVFNYTWTFEYNGTVQELYGSSPTFTFWTEGIYDIALNVSDEEGNFAVSTVTVTVVAQAIPEFGHLLTPLASTIALMAVALAWRRRKRRIRIA